MRIIRIGDVNVAAVVALALTGALVVITLIAVWDAVNRGGLPIEVLVALVAAVTGGVNLILGYFFGRRTTSRNPDEDGKTA